jgi:ABC-type sugar transport system ATPase subunit
MMHAVCCVMLTLTLTLTQKYTHIHTYTHTYIHTHTHTYTHTYTHTHTQEADFLGDNIMIMHGGRVRAVGDPLFLKQTYGAGYQVRGFVLYYVCVMYAV